LYAPIVIFQDFSVFSTKKLFGGPNAHLDMVLETPFSPLSFGKSFMKIRSAVPENGCLIFMHYHCGKQKKKTKNAVKHTHLRPLAARMHKRGELWT